MLDLLLSALVALAATGPDTTAGSDSDPRPPLLRSLDGDWIMTGDVMGKPVQYRLTVSPTLAGGFTELHMLDVQVPPRYEARVFLGHDRESGEIIAHWMDVFGAKGSVPHGTGRIDGNTIEFIVPYPDNPFRDRLTRDAAAGTWTFTIEASDGNGAWKHFAAYSIAPAR